MTVEQLKESICKDIIVDAYERHDRKFLVTRFTYPVGDSVNLYLTGDGDEQRLSDLGTTYYFLRVEDVDMDTEARMAFVKSVCAGFDIEVGDDFVLSKPITPSTASSDVLAFCQAITRISALHYDQRAQQNQAFVSEVEQVLYSITPPGRIHRNWTNRTIDPQGNYPIDFHLNSSTDARNVFLVRGRISAETAIGTMNFHLAKKHLDDSMTIVAPDLTLPRKVEKKLEMTSRLLYGAEEKIIKNFVSAGFHPSA